jgi:hypothetical protein
VPWRGAIGSGEANFKPCSAHATAAPRGRGVTKGHARPVAIRPTSRHAVCFHALVATMVDFVPVQAETLSRCDLSL